MTPTADRYRRFAREAAPRSRTYAAWAQAIADDEECLALIDTLSVAQRQPVLVLTAARFSGLTAHGDIRSWLEGEWDAVAEIVRTRATQTNDPRRSTVLVAALAEIAGPIALLEVGASAGLGLAVDRYSHRFVRGEEESWVHPADGRSALELTCVLGDDVPLPTAMPHIVWRAGLERKPVRLDRADDERWLRTLIWPEERERAHQLDLAIALVQRDRPRIVQGDAVEQLSALAAEAPDDANLVVWSPAVLVYLPADARARFATLVGEVAHEWISLDARPVLDGLWLTGDHAGTVLDVADDEFVLSRNAAPLAVVSPHGDRIDRWLAP